MSIRYPHVAERVFNTPLLIQPAKLDAILAGLSQRFGVTLEHSGLQPEAYTTYTGERKKPGYRVINGVGVIDVFGALVHRSRMEADSTFLLGYQEVARMFEAALADAQVGAIVLNMDSPGGEVGGAFDLAEQIYSARGIKPIHAIAGNLAASAGYAIGGAASELSITKTGWAGSIGVVMRHADFSVMLENDGIKVTHIFAGAHKVDGNPYEPLPADVRNKFQTEIETIYEIFVEAVAKYRGMTAAAVRATEAQTFMGQAAVDIGLADRVETPDQLISRLAEQVRSEHQPRATAQTQKETAMSADKDKAVESPTAITQAQHDAALADARTSAAAEARQGERDRISAIVNHEAAEGRKDLAMSLAMNSDMTVESAAKVLESSPKVSQETGARGTGFTDAMAAEGNADVGLDTDNAQDDDAAAAAAIVNA